MTTTRFILVLALAIVALGIYFFAATPKPFPAGSESAARLEPGPYQVSVSELIITDESRATAANGEHADSTQRELPIKIWYPQLEKRQNSLGAGSPLLVYSHGFSGTKDDPAYIGRFLASHGYILVAVEFPLTNLGAPGGPDVMDTINQPADISFVIDTLLSWNDEEGQLLHHRIDPARIALIGHSLGGMTTTLATYHPRLRDQRVAAAVSLAGPLEMFGRQLFEANDIPFLMIASDNDPMVGYHNNGRVLGQRNSNSVLVTLARASHTGFTDQAKYLRFLDNPDRVGCWMVAKKVNEETPLEDMPLYRLFGSEEEGFLRVPPQKICQISPLGQAMPVKRQQDLTLLAVHAFLEAALTNTTEIQQKHGDYLLTTLPQEIDAVSVKKASAYLANSENTAGQGKAVFSRQ